MFQYDDERTAWLLGGWYHNKTQVETEWIVDLVNSAQI